MAKQDRLDVLDHVITLLDRKKLNREWREDVLTKVRKKFKHGDTITSNHIQALVPRIGYYANVSSGCVGRVFLDKELFKKMRGYEYKSNTLGSNRRSIKLFKYIG